MAYIGEEESYDENWAETEGLVVFNDNSSEVVAASTPAPEVQQQYGIQTLSGYGCGGHGGNKD